MIRNRLAAWLFIGLAVNLGWFWRIAVEHGWFVWPLGLAAVLALISRLRRHLDREASR